MLRKLSLVHVLFAWCSVGVSLFSISKTLVELTLFVLNKYHESFAVEDGDISALASSYEELGRKSEFIALKAQVPVQLATYDDHDYCRNDAGRDCHIREEVCPLALSNHARSSSRDHSPLTPPPAAFLSLPI